MPITPAARQREVLYLPTVGHSVVLGPAGSGKSYCAALRCSYLAAEGLDHAGKVLLVTFSNVLTKYLKGLVASMDPSVEAMTIHDVGRKVLAPTGAVPLYNSYQMDALQRRAVSTFKRDNPGYRLSTRPFAFFKDEFAWIAGHGIDSEEEYVDVERVGRSARLLRRDRQFLYGIYESYLSLRRNAGFDYDLNDMPHFLRLALEARTVDVQYRHVVVDEGQDVAPEVLRALSLMAPEDGSITVFGDYAQQIFGRRMSWRSAGLRVPKVWHLEGNYRNTRPISVVAAAIAAMPGFEAEDVAVPKPANRDGPLPVLVGCSTSEAEYRWIRQFLQAFRQVGSVAVLAPTQSARDRLGAMLPAEALRLSRDLGEVPREGLFFGTVHSAKGLEFDAVIMTGCSRDELPRPWVIEGLGEEEARADGLHMLYVGVTRARHNLVVTYIGDPSELLPPPDGLFDVRTAT